MFELYPRHGHRTPQQIAEDAGGSFEPTPRGGRNDESDPNGSRKSASESHDPANHDGKLRPDSAERQ